MDNDAPRDRWLRRGWLILLSLVAAGTGLDDSWAAEDAREALRPFENGDPGWKVRMESLVRIARSGPEAVPVLVERLRDGPPVVRELAAQALGALADPRSRPALVTALEDPSPDVRVYAIRGLLALEEDPGTAALLHRILQQDAVGAVRQAAAWALEREDPRATAIGPALRAYDLHRMDTAKLDGEAPDFELTDVQGKTYRLRDLRGQKSVLLKFYQEPL